MQAAISRRAFWLLLAALFAADVGKHAVTFATGPTALVNDARDYWERGGRVAEGDWLQTRGAVNFRGPLYPMFLGICRWAFGTHALFAVALLQHGLQLLTDVMTAAICWGITRRRDVTVAAYGLAVLCVTCPWYANVVLTETLFQFLMTATLAALVAYHLRPTPSHAMLFAALLGLSILTRPVPKLLWVPLLILFFQHAATWRDVLRIARHAAMAAIALVVVLMPWSLRNAMIFQSTSVASVPPINKWVVCFHDHSAADLPIPATAAGDRLRTLLPGIDENHALRRDGYGVIRQLKAAGLSRRQVDELVTAVCLDAISIDPATFFWKSCKRFGNYWRCTVKDYPFYSTYTADLSAQCDGQMTWRCDAIAEWYEPILSRSPSTKLRWMEFDSLLAIMGAVLLAVRRPTRAIGLSLLAIFLYFPGVTAALEIENYRYRMVIDPCLIVAMTCGLMSGDKRPVIADEPDSTSAA